MEDLTEVCEELVLEVDGALACAVADPATGQALAAALAPGSVLDAQGIGLVCRGGAEMFLGGPMRHFGSVWTGGGSPGGFVREVQVTTAATRQFIAAIPEAWELLLILLTDRSVSIGLGWMVMHRGVERLTGAAPVASPARPAAPRSDDPLAPPAAAPEPSHATPDAVPEAPPAPVALPRPAAADPARVQEPVPAAQEPIPVAADPAPVAERPAARSFGPRGARAGRLSLGQTPRAERRRSRRPEPEPTEASGQGEQAQDSFGAVASRAQTERPRSPRGNMFSRN